MTISPPGVTVVALVAAWMRARRGKRRRAERALTHLREAIDARTYRPRPYEVFTVREPTPRTIAALAFGDRVVQHAAMAEVAPRIIRTLAPQTWACLPGRGSHGALRAVTAFARHRTHALRLDVRRFFPSVDHAVLRALLARVLRGAPAWVTWLCEVFLEHDGPFERARFHFAGDDLFSVLRPHGLPIGNLTSQWWANLVLSPIDHLLANHLGVRHFARYMDDLVVLDDDPRRLEAIWRACDEAATRLRLRLHPSKCRITSTREGFRFVGFDLRRVGDGVRVRIADEAVDRFAARLSTLKALHAVGAVDDATVRARVSSWEAHAEHGHTRALCAALRRDHAWAWR